MPEVTVSLPFTTEQATAVVNVAERLAEWFTDLVGGSGSGNVRITIELGDHV